MNKLKNLTKDGGWGVKSNTVLSFSKTTQITGP